MAPSPTADATRLIEPWRTSPAKKIPGELDSRNMRFAIELPPRAATTVGQDVGSGQEEAGVVATHPVDASRGRHTSDQDEERVGVDDLDPSRDVDVQASSRSSPSARTTCAFVRTVMRGCASQRATRYCDIPSASDLARTTSVTSRGELGEIQGCLARRVRAADDEHMAVAVVRGLAWRRPVVHAGTE